VAAPAIEEVADTAIPETVPEELTPEREPPREPAGQVAEMRRLIDAEPDAARQAEMQVYLDQLAPLADEDGNLPQNLLVVAEDIFGRLA
jgi:hypothetical protein